jgi:hypothetical protein
VRKSARGLRGREIKPLLKTSFINDISFDPMPGMVEPSYVGITHFFPAIEIGL